MELLDFNVLYLHFIFEFTNLSISCRLTFSPTSHMQSQRNCFTVRYATQWCTRTINPMWHGWLGIPYAWKKDRKDVANITYLIN